MSLHLQSIGLFIGLTMLSGCQSAWVPWASHNSSIPTLPKSDVSIATDSAGKLQTIAGQKTSMTYHIPGPEPTQQQALAEVLAELQEVGAIDPDAQKTLMDDLRAAKPSHWPLIVEQFRTALAYRKQLAEREKKQGASEHVFASDQSTTTQPSDSTAGSIARNDSIRPVSATHHSVENIAHDPFNDSAPRTASREDLSVSHHENSSFTPNEIKRQNSPNPSHQPATRSAEESPRPLSPLPSNNPLRRTSIPMPQPLPELPNSETGLSSGVVQATALANLASSSQRFPTYPKTNRSPVGSPVKAANHSKAISDTNRDYTETEWQRALQTTIAQLEKETANAPTTDEEIRNHAWLRMLYLISGRAEEAMEPIPGISPVQQDYWSKQLFALSTYVDAKKQPNTRKRATAARIYLAEAANLLAEMSELSVRNLAFCKSVSGFGIYESIEEPIFAPGQLVTLYVEADNYKTESTEKGFHTVLATSYEILDEHNNRIAKGEFRDVEDYCKNVRKDYHIQYGLVLPKRIYGGKYKLQLILVDRLSNKIGRRSIPFRIKEVK